MNGLVPYDARVQPLPDEEVPDRRRFEVEPMDAFYFSQARMRTTEPSRYIVQKYKRDIEKGNVTIKVQTIIILFYRWPKLLAAIREEMRQDSKGSARFWF